jgi:hypothetical protein
MLRIGRMSRAATTLAFSAAALLAGGCATTQPSSVPYAPLPVGTTLVTSQTSTGSYGSGTNRVVARVGERTWQGERVLSVEGPQGAIISRPSDGLRIGALAPDGKPIFTLNPPVGPEFPLAPGKTWTRQTQITAHPSGQTTSLESTWTVGDFEDVAVPAGTFRSIRFSYVDRVGGAVWNEDSYWYSPELKSVVKSSLRRPSTHPAGAGTRDSVMLERPKAP